MHSRQRFAAPVAPHHRMRIVHALCLWGVYLLVSAAGNTVRADEEPAKTQEPTEAKDSAEAQASAKVRSPWILLPTFSNNPKLGTAVGGLAGYARKFDPQSQVSIFGLSAQYTSTNSMTAVLFARTSFDSDQHRLNVIAVAGRIKNVTTTSLELALP